MPGTWVEIQIRARLVARPEQTTARWTRFYRVARWDSLASGSARQSFDGERDDEGVLATDTLLLAAPADAVQRWSTDQRSRVPALPRLDDPLPRCRQTVHRGVVIHG